MGKFNHPIGIGVLKIFFGEMAHIYQTFEIKGFHMAQNCL